MFWTSLAVELREMILTALMQERGSVAHFASVCREWQAIIEKRNFSRLKLTVPRLAEFGEIATRKRSYVKYVWLCIELQEYDCSECEQGETDTWYENNTEIIQGAISRAFCTLSKWNPQGRLALDISVHSPSDSKHHFKNVHFGSDGMGSVENEHVLSSNHDPRHGWVSGTQVSLPAVGSVNRLFEDIEFASDFWQGVPEVTAVTSLLLRRQTRRRWEPGTIEELLKLLPSLQEVYYEPWREWGRLDQRISDKSSQLLFASLVPNRLKKMVVFEDFNDTYITLNKQGPHELLSAEPVRTADRAVTRALAEASLTLEHLSAAFIVDARWFFNARQSDWVWKELVSLTLTSRQLVPEGNLADTNDMLQTAAEAAKKMPRLKNMELWNGGKAFAGVFRYQAATAQTCRPATITWRGNWDLPLVPKVTRSWEAVAKQFDPYVLHVIKEILGVNTVIQSHGDAVCALGFSHQVACPVSLWQIQVENSV